MLDIIEDIQPISDFKRKTPDFVERLKKTGRPVVLTMNGRAEVVVQDAASYQKMVEVLARANEIEAIREGLTDLQNGATVSLDEFDEVMRDRHNILRS